jgi:hypothetical protein
MSVSPYQRCEPRRPRRARPYGFVTRSIAGITYRMNVKADNCSVWVVVSRRDPAARAEALASLQLNQRLIERAYGREIEVVGGTAEPFVWARASEAGLQDRERWPTTAGELAAAMARLFAAVQPYL